MAAIAEHHFLIVLRPNSRPAKMAGIYLAALINPAHSEHLSWDHLLGQQKTALGLEVRLRVFGDQTAQELDRRLAQAAAADKIMSWKRVPPDWKPATIPAFGLDQHRPHQSGQGSS
jgi:hypothetical protein